MVGVALQFFHADTGVMMTLTMMRVEVNNIMKNAVPAEFFQK
jgi:hypothetical protein